MGELETGYAEVLGEVEYKMKAYILNGRYQLFMNENGYRSLPSGPLRAELQDADGGDILNKKVILKLNKEAITSESETVPLNAYFDDIEEIHVTMTERDYEALWESGLLSIRSGPGFDISIVDDLSGMM